MLFMVLYHRLQKISTQWDTEKVYLIIGWQAERSLMQKAIYKVYVFVYFGVTDGVLFFKKLNNKIKL